MRWAGEQERRRSSCCGRYVLFNRLSVSVQHLTALYYIEKGTTIIRLIAVQVPRLSQSNVRALPAVVGVERPNSAKVRTVLHSQFCAVQCQTSLTARQVNNRGRGQQGFDYGWGSSARQKLHFGPLGYEAGGWSTREYEHLPTD